jgi:RIO kinase 1
MSSDHVPNPGFTSPDFTFTWQTTTDLLEGQRQSTYPDAEKLCKGPDPVPGWVVTERAALDTYLGILKTGKEADCLLMERAVPGGRGSVLAAKRYRGEEHRLFHRDPQYTDGRRTRRSRDARAVSKKTTWGRTVAAGHWAWAEWEALKRFWSAGIPVPYPVQLDGTEILMELVEHDGEPAPRLVQTRPSGALLEGYFEQLREAMLNLAMHGAAHGDLSPYNVLAAGDRVVLIDLPQVVDLAANPAGLDLLARDCRNVCAWFTRRGLDVDEDALFGDLLAQVL